MNECVVCGTSPLITDFTVFHGIAACEVCGVTYAMKGFYDREETVCTMTEEAIAVIKEYWEETKQHMWFSFCETEQQKIDRVKVNKWTLENHPEIFEKSEQDEQDA